MAAARAVSGLEQPFPTSVHSLVPGVSLSQTFPPTDAYQAVDFLSFCWDGG